MDCYNLDEARSVQFSPYVPLDDTSNYENENGRREDVLIDNLVVGGPDCPGPGVLVHRIHKCFIRQEGSTVTLSFAAYGGVISAGAFDLTPHLPVGTSHFFLRFTALDQGVEGALDRVFLNVDFPGNND